MKINKMRTNRIKNPLGFDIERPVFSWQVAESEEKYQKAARIEVSLNPEFTEVIYDSGMSSAICSSGYEVQLKKKSRTRYYWRVTVYTEQEEVQSEAAWFETAKEDEVWKGKWITPNMDHDIFPIMTKSINIGKPIQKARAYICGLGVYECYINGQKAGNEYLAPGCNAYDKWLQYQTYDVSNLLQGGENSFEISLGNGWYKGRMSGTKVYEGEGEGIYGNQFLLLCEIVLTFADGTTEVVGSDETWQAMRSKILASNIYDGETYDARILQNEVFTVRCIEAPAAKLIARRSIPVIQHEILRPVLICTPAGEQVLDFGQNLTGQFRFKVKEKRNREIILTCGEILQQGNFYNENYRTAKAEYRYFCDGTCVMARPQFTFYGFRYLKVEGIETVEPKDFEAIVLYSDLETTGNIKTGNTLVNQLIENTMWGQKGNFLDNPTDCPQRDERLGWTGDAQMFSATACYQMDCAAFFSKYHYDLSQEQQAAGGSVPMIVPTFGNPAYDSCAWGDAATIIPWNLYLFYGDVSKLREEFPSMRAWVDKIRRVDEEHGGKRLWTTGFHFGDWLSLDAKKEGTSTGGTDPYFIASAYYCYSARLTAKAAAVLGHKELQQEYETLSKEVEAAIRKEYFSGTGRATIQTQTAYTLALWMNLIPEDWTKRTIDGLAEALKERGNYLATGFVGTPLLCPALSEYGRSDLAYTLLLNENYPGWLYEVKKGATTIWERWNSVLEDGSMNPKGMNSLNHYAYGSIVGWIYRYAAGIQPLEDHPGFKRIRFAPNADQRLGNLEAVFQSVSGRYTVKWHFNEQNYVCCQLSIPFDANAELWLNDALPETITINDKVSPEAADKGKVILPAGNWKICYYSEAAVSASRKITIESTIAAATAHPEAEKILRTVLDVLDALPAEMMQKRICDLAGTGLGGLEPEKMKWLQEQFAKIS